VSDAAISSFQRLPTTTDDNGQPRKARDFENQDAGDSREHRLNFDSILSEIRATDNTNSM